MIDKKELKNMDVTGLNNEIGSLKKELFNLRIAQCTGQVKNHAQFKNLRAQIARILTFVTQKGASGTQQKLRTK